MNSDPLREPINMLEAERSDPDLGLPKISLAPRYDPSETYQRGSFIRDAKADCHTIARQSWRFLIDWFDSWFRTVIAGGVVGAIIGFVYRWILQPS
jgi:hypothetical protein